MSRHLAIATLLLLLLPACADDLTPSSRVVRSQAIAGRVDIEGDTEGRAQPRPGETANVRIELAHPGPPPLASWVFLACAAAPVRFGEPVCGSDPLGLFGSSEPTAEEPTFSIDVPAEGALGDAESLLVLGAICFTGSVSFDEEALRACEDEDGVGELIALTIPLDLDEAQDNHHPRVEGMVLAGAPWDDAPPVDAPLLGCAGDDAAPTFSLAAIEASDQGTLVIDVLTNEDSRESFVEEAGDPPEPTTRVEELQVSHVTTVGQLERRYSFIDEADPDVDVEWEPTDTEDLEVGVEPEGRLVRFWFSVRDLRGGVAVAERALCLVP